MLTPAHRRAERRLAQHRREAAALRVFACVFFGICFLFLAIGILHGIIAGCIILALPFLVAAADFLRKADLKEAQADQEEYFHLGKDALREQEQKRSRPSPPCIDRDSIVRWDNPPYFGR
jgi:MFS superfamily sulfate permease-like transporter